MTAAAGAAAAVTRQRMATQFLTTPGPSRGSEIVRSLLAVQAQDYAGAKWALGQRAGRPLTDADIEAECTAGRILRTHVMRPTWHFVVPEDIRWLLALTAPRVNAAMASYNRKMGLTPAVLARSNDVIARALEGGQSRTRAELKVALERGRVVASPPQRLGHLMMHAELDAVVCSGPRRGKQFTYALLDERAPRARLPERVHERDEALAEIATRYFLTRGPASVHDFSWWSGLTMGDARRAIAVAGRALARREVGGTPMWSGAAARSGAARVSAHLLPNYDEYFIGYKDRSAIGARLRSVSAVTGGSAFIAHVAFLDGQLVGGWRMATRGDALVVDITLATAVTAAERRRLAGEGRHLGAFFARDAEVRFS